MKHINPLWIPLLDEAIQTSINQFSFRNGEDFLADLYIYADEEYVLHFYDDMERELHSVQLDRKTEDKSSIFEKQLSQSLRQALQNLDEKGFFDKAFILKPFSISIVDKDFMITEELIFVDDDMVKINDKLLTDLDDELNAFFKDLMNK